MGPGCDDGGETSIQTWIGFGTSKPGDMDGQLVLKRGPGCDSDDRT
jgi:hypothetical protein